MTVQEVRDYYSVDANGLISDPGKFESEPIYVPYFWDQIGGADEDQGRLQGIILTAQDLTDWPELVADKWAAGDTLWLLESSNGFVDVITSADAQEFIDDEDTLDEYGR